MSSHVNIEFILVRHKWVQVKCSILYFQYIWYTWPCVTWSWPQNEAVFSTTFLPYCAPQNDYLWWTFMADHYGIDIPSHQNYNHSGLLLIHFGLLQPYISRSVSNIPLIHSQGLWVNFMSIRSPWSFSPIGGILV